jgi:malonate decarboxylase beta subunit
MVGCFGGMSLAAALCTHLIVTPQARLGMNGPEVIEQEAGIEELDAADRGLIWSLIGGEQRYATGFADDLLEDDADAVAAAVRKAFSTAPASAPAPAQAPAQARSMQVERYLELLRSIDPSQPPDGESLRRLWKRGSPP